MYALEIENLCYTYPDLTLALKGINLKVREAKKTAILGANGSGKTTLIYHINGLIPVQQGSVKVRGKIVNKESVKYVRRLVGLLFDSPDNQLFSTTVFSDIAFGPRNMRLAETEVNKRVEKILTVLGIDELAERPPYCLSLGQKKRVAIAGLLTMEPQLLVCDEPFSGLDPAVANQFRDLLDQLISGGKTLLYSTHDVDLAYAWADEVIVMKGGSILAAGPVELLQDDRLMEKACLQLPVLARLFKNSVYSPRTVEEAAQMLGKAAPQKPKFGGASGCI
jgi:cobalt/nickel transport system ATP-binding protein